MSLSEIDRRRFLRMGMGVCVGLATGAVSVPLTIQANESIQKITGRYEVNAGLEEWMAEFCKGQDISQEECLKRFVVEYEPLVTVIGPVFEEISFRAIPSMGLSMLNREDPVTTLSGNGGVLLTRRELGVGIISSVLFAGVHNLTRKGFDAETFPVTGVLFGSALWYLQRKFGLLANTLAHMTNNFIAAQLVKNYSHN